MPRGLANLGSFDAAKLAKLRMGIEATPGAVPVDRSTTKPAARANATSARAADHFVTEHAADVQPAPAATAKDSDAGSALTISTSSMPTLAPAGTSICENGAPADSAGAEAAVTAPGEAGAIVDEHNPIDSAVRPDAPAAALVAKAGAGCEAAATEDNAARAVDGAALHLPKGDTNVSGPGHSPHACYPCWCRMECFVRVKLVVLGACNTLHCLAGGPDSHIVQPIATLISASTLVTLQPASSCSYKLCPALCWVGWLPVFAPPPGSSPHLTGMFWARRCPAARPS